ncbi:asparagine synthase (glutamine-hydrolyzing) [Flavobacteriaceae bacterium S356]|uniref:asparagine synthase (glutamine-hydrolyzing) n=1 Tax=Asprobacillus argus TaxID=3076534 RepID=A0ABU3LI98_9FLAO|nr:asparagine synthase (glutamine-hydrolyzing) [Flavobacteriaceae bacterium S356]
MCGICGIIYKDSSAKVTEELLKPTVRKMNHRGPDDNGIHCVNNVGLGFVRLAILDLSKAGHQPMTSVHGRFTIVFNGEIYNYIELRQELLKKGHVFNSNSDTEVLLALYTEYGESFLDKLNGMFAFAILDNETGDVFGARDRFGIKPLYYLEDSEKVAFASEIDSLLEFPNVAKSKINDNAIYNYFVYNRTDYDDTTFFNNIKKVPHGHTFKFSNGRLVVERWYNLRDNIDKPFSNGEEFRDMLVSSVSLRLRSDVPVGACLSGGLDSSALVSILDKEFGISDVHTFSSVYNTTSRENEKPFIDEFQGRLKNMNFVFPDANSFMDDLEDLIHSHSEPFSTPAIYAQYKVMQSVQGKVTVLLDGQGADEYLAGYDYFYGFYLKELFRNIKWLTFIKESAIYKKYHKTNNHLKYFVYFMLPSSLRRKAMQSKKGYLRSGFEESLRNESSFNDLMYGSNSLIDSLINHFEYKLEHLLKWEDTNSMRFSLESRVPFLDHRVVEGAIGMKNSSKLNKGITKAVLREQFSSIIPKSIIDRREKIGFATPADNWFREERFVSYVKDILNSNMIVNSDMINYKIAEEQYNRHLKGEINVGNEIWKWINFYNWNQKNTLL